MKKAIRFLSLFLVIVLLSGMLPVGEFSLKSVAAASNQLTYQEVTQRIENYMSVCGGRYWNKGLSYSKTKELADKGDYLGATSGSACDVTKHKDNKHTDAGCQSNRFTGLGMTNGRQCAGFAVYLEYVVFGNITDGWKKISKGSVSDDFQFHAGDLVRFKNTTGNLHSVVIAKVSKDGETLTLAEGNYNGRCHINYGRTVKRSWLIGRIKLSGYVYRSPAIEHTHVYNSIGDCECGAHRHVYGEDGLCIKESCKFNYYTQANLSTAANGIATAKSGNSFYVYTKPYMASGRVQTKWLGTINKDLAVSQATVVSEITNHLGNKWYQLKVASVSYPVYVSVDTVQVQWRSLITITGVSAPKDQAVAGEGAKTTVKGTVSVQKNKVSEVTAAVYNVQDLSAGELYDLRYNKLSAAQAYSLAQSKAKYYGHNSDINAEKFDLKQYDSKLAFRKLAGGHDYLYVITATDNYKENTCSPHQFHLRTSSSAKTSYSVSLITGGTAKVQTVAQGDSLALPEKSRAGYSFQGWADSEEAYDVIYAAGTAFSPAGNTVLYAVFDTINPPAAPVLTATSYDIAEGATQTVSWNAVDSATSYAVYVYDVTGTRVYEQATSGTFAIIPFQGEGEYSVRVEAFNGSTAGGSGESAQSVTVHVHGSSTATFLNYDGSVYATQDVSYGGTVSTPTSPSRKGYSFSHWEGKMSQIVEDTTLTAVYTPEQYLVNFYDANGGVMNTQYVTYNGDTPGSAVAPAAPQKENYTFVGWSRDFAQVTESGINVYPVYVWANQDVPLSIQITNVTSAGDGYWVYYTVTNHVSRTQLGRVVIAGKTSLGKFITQTESGAFYLNSGDGASYQGNAYVPVGSADMLTLATVEAYVVDNYVSKNPIAEPDTYHIGSVDGEYTAWMTAEDLAAFTGSYSETETATQYRSRTKSTYSTTANYYLGWPVESTTTTPGSWGNWSGWQDAAVSANSNTEVETRQVLVSDAHTEYRYGRWYAATAIGDPSGKTYTPAVSPAFAHANKNYKNASSVFAKDFSSWSTTRTDPYPDWWIRTTLHDSDQTYYQVSGGYYYWHKYYPGGTESNANKYFWEESRTVPAQYKTQYRYRMRNSDVITYTYYNWSDWTDYSFTAATPTESRQVETRTVYRVKLTTGLHGSTYTFSGEVGPVASGKQALLNVYKVDAASDYSNQYIEQVTLGANGAYSFSFDTLETPSPDTGDYTVSLTIEGGTESLYIGTIPAPKPQYTVKFVDEVTGLSLEDQVVSEGSAAIAPEVPEHEGYLFLGWEYGLGNIRENMTINARYVKRGYTVVFVDNVQMSVSMENDIPYETPVIAPEITAPEGYIFIGWEVPDGMSLDSVTDHMIVTAKYEHITNVVSFLDVNENVIAQETVNYGDYAVDPFVLSIEAEPEMDSDPPVTPDDSSSPITEDDLNIPESMYFLAWSEGAEDPVTQTLTLTPMLSFFDDVGEVISTLEGGIYAGGQITTLTMADEPEGINVQYRITAVDGEEGEWTDYDISTSPEIPITETCLLEIEANATNCNSFTVSYEYIIVPTSDLLPAPANVTAEQNDTESVQISWSAVTGATGYKVLRTSDCDELAEFDAGNATSFVDYGVDTLRTYTYQVCAYSLRERSGSSMKLEGNVSAPAEVFFHGDNIMVSSVSVVAAASVLEGSATRLSATVSPVDAYDTTVTWVCTDGTGEGFVTDDGLFYGLSAGDVTVTAMALDGSQQSDSVTINVQEISVGEDYATMTVSSAQARAGGTADVSVSITENSLAEIMQFAVLYDSSKLTLTSFKEGSAMEGLSPTINNPAEGIVLFVWEGLTSLTEGGSLLDLTFEVKQNASGTAVVEIPTESDQYDFVFARGADATDITVVSINGALDITSLILGDVDGNEKVNVMDANLIRRYAAWMIDLNGTQLLSADVNGDGKVNVIDANLIRRYVAHLIDVFPADTGSTTP